MFVVVIVVDIDIWVIIRCLWEEGSLIGVLIIENFKIDDELIEMVKIWKIVGIRLNCGNCKLLCYVILWVKVNVYVFKC